MGPVQEVTGGVTNYVARLPEPANNSQALPDAVKKRAVDRG
jgi:hypothetical protein